MVVGDETRLRQIITNLARLVPLSGELSARSLRSYESNACKFTPSGGKLTISTQLIMPSTPPDDTRTSGEGSDTRVSSPTDSVLPRPLSSVHLSQHNLLSTPLERIVVRIEVTDTGYGIRPKDMAECKLFCTHLSHSLDIREADQQSF
jgi:osomolarity two-component system sensor histidine kinase SLN1